jgi:hypothetical protein
MQLSSISLALLAAGLLAGAPANAQPASGTTAAEKQPTQADGPPSVGPASGAFKEYSDPKAWDADTRAWHAQHTDARESIGYSDQQRREADQNVAPSADTAVNQ